MQLQVVETLTDAAAAAAERVATSARAAVARRGGFAMALSGGSTPAALYTRLAAPPLRHESWWSQADLFWGDERAVPPDDPESNYRMARETLIDPLSLPEVRVHRMRVEAPDLDRAAAEYERELRRVVADRADGMPVLDLVLLGLGADGHTASLFPGSPALHVSDRAVTATDVPGVGRRLTFTFPALLAARVILVLVSGGAKAAALEAVLYGSSDPQRWPAQRLRDAGERVTWIVDRATAERRE